MESCCNASKSSRSIWSPVENGRPVAGHFTENYAHGLPSVRTHPNATIVPLWPLNRTPCRWVRRSGFRRTVDEIGKSGDAEPAGALREVDARINVARMSEIHISVAAIAQLTACSPQAVHKALEARQLWTAAVAMPWT